MGEFSNIAEERLARFGYVLSATPFALTKYVHLYSVAPDIETSSGGTEIFGGGYAAQVVTFGWASDGASSNIYDIKFKCTSGSWTIVSMAIKDSGGLYIGGQPIGPVTVTGGNTFIIRSGALVVGFDSDPDDNE
jgi:hypothetical protein